jgi:diacylglycerol kinase (ATP)
MFVGTKNDARVKVSYEHKELKRKMINYMSIGGDARVGLGFEKHRGSSRCMNTCCHCWEGFKKCCFTKTMRMDDIIVKVSKINEQAKDPKSDTVIVACKAQATVQDNFFVDNPASLLFSNIPSLMGGRSKPWASTKDKPLGITTKGGAPQIKFADQDYGDGKLEISIFPSQLSISLETLWGGNANRVAQDAGPFRIDFQNSTVYLRELLKIE